MLDEYFTSTVFGSVCVGLGLVLLASQRPARTNVGAGINLVFVGLAVMTGVPLVDNVDRADPGLPARVQVVFEAGAVCGSATYLLGLLRSARTTTPRVTRLVGLSVRTGYLLGAALVVLGAFLPVARLDDYEFGLGSREFASHPGVWVFVAYWLAVIAVFSAAWLALVRQEFDPGEHTRALCSMIASPFLVIATAVPLRWAIASIWLATLVALLGQFRYLVSEGERAAFLGQFLSRQVADRVRVGGLASVVKPDHVELSVVCCDLRGFTAYAEGVPSQAVIDLLGDYYEAVGVAVAEVDGTIKDYAGDGILVLVGAPLHRPDHASAGVALARRIHEVTAPVLERWATPAHPLGIGIGVATGRATVGAIGSPARLEYTAVGTPVNLAARLCSVAAAAETLVDERTARLAGVASLEPRPALDLKGLSGPQAVYATI